MKDKKENIPVVEEVQIFDEGFFELNENMKISDSKLYVCKKDGKIDEVKKED